MEDEHDEDDETERCDRCGATDHVFMEHDDDLPVEWWYDEDCELHVKLIRSER